MISVITPVWNGARTIQKCIDSVRAQINADYEHIIIDGNSIDNTVAICEHNLHDKMRILKHRHKCIYEKMNDGIDFANGEWIYFISADDVFISYDVLQRFAVYARQFPTKEIIYGDIYSERLNKNVDGEFNNVDVLTRNVPVMFYKKTLFNKIGYFNIKYKYLSDYDFTMRCWLSGKVSHQYVPLVTISYADGGVSSTCKDRAFKKDHIKNCIMYIVTGGLKIQHKFLLLILLPIMIIKKKINMPVKQSVSEVHDRLIRMRYLR